MRLRALTCLTALAVASLASPAVAAHRTPPASGVLYVGTATEDGRSAGAVSLRVGKGATSLVSLLGGHFHGDLCAGGDAMFAGPGGINPPSVTLHSNGTFSGSQVTTGLDGSRIASSLHGVFSASASSLTAILSYAVSPPNGAMACTVTASLALHKAPATPTGKVTPPRKAASYHVVTHQGWTTDVVVDRKVRSAAVNVAAWDLCHYTAVPAVHFLYPEHVRTTVKIAHGRFVGHVRSTGGAGSLDATITGAFVGAGHHLAGALHVRRSGSVDGNAFVCDSQRVLFSAT
jgi:hypothetical protein